LIEEPEGKTPLAIHFVRWEDNIKMSLKNNGQEGGDWIYVAEYRDQWGALLNTATGNKICMINSLSVWKHTATVYSIRYFSRHEIQLKNKQTFMICYGIIYFLLLFCKQTSICTFTQLAFMPNFKTKQFTFTEHKEKGKR
jgi:hypothetical protein